MAPEDWFDICDRYLATHNRPVLTFSLPGSVASEVIEMLREMGYQVGEPEEAGYYGLWYVDVAVPEREE